MHMVFVLKSTHNCLLGVLLGNQVKNQSFEAAMFQDLGNSPASFEASLRARHVGSNCHQRLCRVSVTGVGAGDLRFP